MTAPDAKRTPVGTGARSDVSRQGSIAHSVPHADRAGCPMACGSECRATACPISSPSAARS